MSFDPRGSRLHKRCPACLRVSTGRVVTVRIFVSFGSIALVPSCDKDAVAVLFAFIARCAAWLWCTPAPLTICAVRVVAATWARAFCRICRCRRRIFACVGTVIFVAINCTHTRCFGPTIAVCTCGIHFFGRSFSSRFNAHCFHLVRFTCDCQRTLCRVVLGCSDSNGLCHIGYPLRTYLRPHFLYKKVTISCRVRWQMNSTELLLPSMASSTWTSLPKVPTKSNAATTNMIFIALERREFES